jgi:hypothetical protein
MTKLRTIVKTEATLDKELSTLSEKIVENWFQDREPNIPNVVMTSTMIVEKYSGSVSKLESKDKFRAAQTLIPVIVDLLVVSGKISVSDGATLKETLNLSVELIKELIEAYVILSKNPTYLQFEAAVKDNGSKCFAGCYGKK